MAAPHRVLVIDDDLDIRECLADVLSCAGYEVQTAPNGREALETLPDFRPTLVLLDLMMPVMTGQEFLARLRSERHFSRLPVVVVTAGVDASAPGANALLTKPFEVDHLLDVVADHCQAA